MNSYQKIIFLLLVLSYAVMGFSQSYTSMPVSNNNTVHYEGRMDDINTVKMTLSCIGSNCSGEFIYIKSGDRFRLAGTINGNQIQLEEYDRNNQRSGFIKGKYMGNAIQAVWENTTQTVGSKVLFKETTPQTTDYSDCGANKWIHSYSGQIDKKEVELVLQKIDNQRIVGAAYFLKDKTKYAIRGELNSNNNLVLNLIDPTNQNQLGSIRAIYKNGQELNASFYNSNNSQSFASLQLDSYIEMNCIEYADYFSNYDFLYPKSHDPLFDQIMSFLIKDWIQECKTTSSSIRNNPSRPDLRASQRGYAWTEITQFKDHFLSGLLTFHNTWNEEKMTKAFNYDFANKASIELEDIFKRKFDYRTYIKDYIRASLLADNTYKYDISYQAWMDQQNFTLFTVGKEGLEFFTDFHSIYGRQSVVLPYKKIKSNVKKKSTIRRFF